MYADWVKLFGWLIACAIQSHQSPAPEWQPVLPMTTRETEAWEIYHGHNLPHKYPALLPLLGREVGWWTEGAMTASGPWS
jgi:hypothetical protein